MIRLANRWRRRKSEGLVPVGLRADAYYRSSLHIFDKNIGSVIVVSGDQVGRAACKRNESPIATKWMRRGCVIAGVPSMQWLH